MCRSKINPAAPLHACNKLLEDFDNRIDADGQLLAVFQAKYV